MNKLALICLLVLVGLSYSQSNDMTCVDADNYLSYNTTAEKCCCEHKTMRMGSLGKCC